MLCVEHTLQSNITLQRMVYYKYKDQVISQDLQP